MRRCSTAAPMASPPDDTVAAGGAQAQGAADDRLDHAPIPQCVPAPASTASADSPDVPYGLCAYAAAF